MNIKIDTEKTLLRFTASAICVSDWCKARGFKRDRFYSVVGNRSLKNSNAVKALRLMETLKREGLLVLQDEEALPALPVECATCAKVHNDHNISCSPSGKLEQNGDL